MGINSPVVCILYTDGIRYPLDTTYSGALSCFVRCVVFICTLWFNVIQSLLKHATKNALLNFLDPVSVGSWLDLLSSSTNILPLASIVSMFTAGEKNKTGSCAHPINVSSFGR